MLPPERTERDDGGKKKSMFEVDPFVVKPAWIDAKAPLSEWHQYRAFDRATDCERARAGEQTEGQQLIDRLNREIRAETRPEGFREPIRDDVRRFVERLAIGRCVSAADPRLAPKR